MSVKSSLMLLQVEMLFVYLLFIYLLVYIIVFLSFEFSRV